MPAVAVFVDILVGVFLVCTSLVGTSLVDTSLVGAFFVGTFLVDTFLVGTEERSLVLGVCSPRSRKASLSAVPE